MVILIIAIDDYAIIKKKKTYTDIMRTKKAHKNVLKRQTRVIINNWRVVSNRSGV